MLKEEALNGFWNSFGIPAYDERTVPEDANLPYITYEVITDGWGAQNVLTASIWDRNTSWGRVTTILNKVAEKVGYGGYKATYDDGQIWIKKATPFAQRMTDEDDSIRRIIINIEVEYISEV
jgi:hypothetical protein